MITPEDFETLVRDTMYEVDGQTHPDPDMPERLITNARQGTTILVPFGKRRSWISPLIAAAAVIALAATIALATSSWGRTHTPPGTQAPNPRNSTGSAPTPNPASKCLTAAQALAIVSRERGGTVTLARHSASSFACADGWAYLNFQGPVSPNTATVDLQYVNGKWIIGDRSIACGDANGVGTRPPAMVPALVRNGCGN
ncbi:MAG: hypothetical protein QOG80_3079 [Pseudonocardiales bacterium]|jgi:hypothetical protein|nr:hypothetical protein [Pseudonocardiales bacterium]